MYGDFEAQRHWLEITYNLPISDWYRNTSENDLLYWGLDYPPLTAYVSKFFAYIADGCWPQLVSLGASRGHESIQGKTFMRASVMLCDLVIFIPSVMIASRTLSRARQGKDTVVDLQTALFQFLIIACPSLLLIDHGHFQYNGFCIGLAVLAASMVTGDYDITGSVLFCLSLNFKQMALYYAPVFFCVLLRKCFICSSSHLRKLMKLITIGATVIATFAALWAPFCLFSTDSCTSQLGAILTRLFPFNRGIFEDKVSNLWYATSVVVDFRTWFPVEVLARFSLLLTLLLLAPTCYNLLTEPLSRTRMVLGLINSSLAFFLASFQVHEKSLLLVAVPVTFLFPIEPLLVAWFQVFAGFTMFPLLIRDGLRLPYFAVNAMYLVLVKLYSMTLPQQNVLSLATLRGLVSRRSEGVIVLLLQYAFLFISTLGMLVLHVLEATILPPERLPDLYAALFSLFGAMNLIVVYAYCNTWQLMLTSSDEIEETGLERKVTGQSVSSDDIPARTVSPKRTSARIKARMKSD
jgi:alpha-1,3-glucosyltransferase